MKAEAFPPRSGRPRGRSFDFFGRVFFSSSALEEDGSLGSDAVSQWSPQQKFWT